MIIMLCKFLKTSILAQNEMLFCISQFLFTVFAYSHPRWDGFTITSELHLQVIYLIRVVFISLRIFSVVSEWIRCFYSQSNGIRVSFIIPMVVTGFCCYHRKCRSYHSHFSAKFQKIKTKKYPLWKIFLYFLKKHFLYLGKMELLYFMKWNFLAPSLKKCLYFRRKRFELKNVL